MKLLNNQFVLLLAENDGNGDGGSGSSQSLLGTGDGTGDGNTNAPTDKPWFASLPEDFRNNPLVQQNEKLESFVKSAIDTKSMVGANTIKIPSEKATKEEWDSYYKKLGRPEEPGAYKPENFDKGDLQLDKEVVDKMLGKFHELGLTKRQGEAILGEYAQTLSTQVEQSQAASVEQFEKAQTELKTEWGQDYDNNVKTAQLAAREIGGPEFFKYAEEKGLANDPTFIRFLQGVGAKLLDDDATGEGEGRFTASEIGAKQEIERLKMDKEFLDVLNNRRDPGHKAAVERWSGLHTIAYPGKQKD